MLVAEEAVEIRVLRRQGKSIREIARMLDVSRNTVRRYLRGEGLPRYERESRPSKLDPYKRYLDERVKAAAPDWIPATVLLRELRALGYQGGYSILKDHLATLTSPPSAADATGWRSSLRRWVGAARAMLNSSPKNGWPRCSAAMSALFTSSAGFHTRCCTTTCARW